MQFYCFFLSLLSPVRPSVRLSITVFLCPFLSPFPSFSARFLQNILICVFALFCVTWGFGTATVYSISWSAAWHPALDSVFACFNLFLGMWITLALTVGPSMVECLRKQLHMSTSCEKSLQRIRRVSLNSYRGRVVRRTSTEQDCGEPQYQTVDNVSPHGRLVGATNGTLGCMEDYELEDWISGGSCERRPTMIEMAEDWERDYISSNSQPTNSTPTQDRQTRPAVHQLQTESRNQADGEFRGGEHHKNLDMPPSGEKETIFMSEILQASGENLIASGGYREEEEQMDFEDEVPVEETKEPEELWYQSGSPPSYSNLTDNLFSAGSVSNHHVDLGDNDTDEVSSQIIEELYQQTRGQPSCRDDIPSPCTIGTNNDTPAFALNEGSSNTPWYKAASECNGHNHDIQPYASIPLAANTMTPPETPPPKTPPLALCPASAQMMTSEPTYAEIPNQPPSPVVPGPHHR